MKLQDMMQDRREITGKIEAILQKAGEEQRALTDRDQKDLVTLRYDANQLDTQIKQRKELSNIGEFDPAALVMGHLVKRGEARQSKPTETDGAEAPKPNLARFQAEWHDWVNSKLGSPWQPKLSASDTPLFIGTGGGAESLEATVPKEVLPYLPAYFNLDSFALAGARQIYTDNTVPLYLPVLSAGSAASTYAEGSAPTESAPFAIDGFTFGGVRYSRLVKASYLALMNSTLPLQGAIQDELLASLATTFTAAITTALLNAFIGVGASCYVAKGGNDIYHALNAVLHSVPPRFARPENKWMMTRESLAAIKDQRSIAGTGQPYFDAVSGQLFGHDVVINDNLSAQVFYGDWESGCIIRKTPVMTRVFYEKYAEQDEVGFRVAQYLDQHFLCETAAPNQPLYFTDLVGGSGS